ncbi:MAG: glycoside hydrolase family 16 protein [Bacteroidetes bacterium]|nr:glycoside hydrolase family 16 protein [Bacteroidota bacterium]
MACELKINAQTVCNGRKVIVTESANCNQSSYVLAFNDEFNGSSLDTSIWKPINGVVRDLEHKFAQQWYSPKNVEVSNGTLKLITKRETFLNQCYSIWANNGVQNICEDFYYSAGQIDSKQKFEHGIFEISCKLPKAKGVASSFWTWGDPAMNEIDVFEFEFETELTPFKKFDPDKACRVQRMNLHTDYDGDGKTIDCPSKCTGEDYSEAFHTFTLIWTPYKIEWYVDGQLKRTSTLFYTLLGQMINCSQIEAGEQYILDSSFPRSAMNIILDNIVEVGNKAPDDGTVLPVSYEIDYIRFYRLI